MPTNEEIKQIVHVMKQFRVMNYRDKKLCLKLMMADIEKYHAAVNKDLEKVFIKEPTC